MEVGDDNGVDLDETSWVREAADTHPLEGTSQSQRPRKQSIQDESDVGDFHLVDGDNEDGEEAKIEGECGCDELTQQTAK
jgi:hypothetical protein